MTTLVLILPVLLSLVITALLVPNWMKRAMKVNLVGKDIQKTNRPEVVEAGGINVVAGFILGVLIYVAIRSFYFNSLDKSAQIFSLVSSLLIISFIGLTDDILGWKIGLSKRLRIFLVLFASIPLVVIKAGESVVSLPFLGTLDLGIIYPLIIIPIGIIGATTTFNFLAGFNGLEAGQGILLISALSLVAYFTGSPWLALIGLCMVASLVSFLIFNFYPAQVFPGDSLTYTVGGLIAIMAILGNFESVAVFFFIPYILEVILKLRGRLRKESFGKPNPDGSLDLLYPKVYGLTHLSILIFKKLGIKATEKRVVYLIWSFQLTIILIGFAIFRHGIFVK